MGSTSPDEPAVDIRFVSRSVTPSEVAAVTAVLAAALEEHRAITEKPRPGSASAWQRSQRGIRRPLDHGSDSWSGLPE